MKLRDAFPSLAAALTALAGGLLAQPAEVWRGFTTADGLPDNACLNLTVGAGGNLLVRHPNTNVVSLFNGYGVTQVPAPDASRNRVYESPGGQLWSVTTEGLLEFWDGNWKLHRVAEIAAHYRAGYTNAPVLCPVRQGRVLVLLTDQLLQFDVEAGRGPVAVLLRAAQSELGTFSAMAPAEDGGLWISGANGFLKIEGPIRNLKTPISWSPTNAVPPAVANQLGHAVVRGSLTQPILDTAGEPGGAVWFATANGLFRVAPAIWTAVNPGAEREIASLQPRNSSQWPRLPEEIAGHSEWKLFFPTRYGDLWLAGDSDVAWRHQNRWQIFSSTNLLGPEGVIEFAESPDGRIWCATADKVWEFDGQNWLGARGGFGQINALHCARNGTLWVATDSGLYRHSRGAWIANGREDGLPATPVAKMVEDAAGRLLVQTTSGWFEFRPDADRDPPETLISSTSGAEVSYREGEMVTLTFAGQDKWEHTRADRLLYSHRIDEREWSPFLEQREVSFAELPVGKHYFQVRAMDRNGNVDLKPARLEFAVLVPWYREARLVWILTVALAVAVFFAGLAFNRHRRLRHSYAEVERQVSERTRELAQANRELLHSQKMNALGTLAAGIAHDFNNILSIVKGSAQIIEENLERPDKIRTRLDRIKLVVHQGAGIVEAMLGFTRGSDQKSTSCDVNAVVEDTVKLLGDRFLRETEVRFERGLQLPEIAVPRDFVQQVLLNFIFNAAEAMERQTPRTQEANGVPRATASSDPGGPAQRKQIRLATRLETAPPPGTVLPPREADRYVAISVMDRGCGISAEDLPRIFEPFFTTKALSARRGTGLGLSMVYELAKKLEAGLCVETVVGQGSNFTILLPVSETTETLQPERETPAAVRSAS